MLSAGDVALVMLAGGWVLLVLFLGYVLVKLAGVLRQTESLVQGVTDRTLPLLSEITTSVVQVNGQLERVDTITSNAATVTSNVAALTTLFGATLGGPLVKVAAFSYGVRRAAGKRSRNEVEREVKANVRAAKSDARAARKAGR